MLSMDIMEPLGYDEKVALARIGAMVRSARKRHGLTQIELAALAEMSPTVVGRVENGLQGISALRLARLAALLGISLDSLMGLEHAHHRSPLPS